MGGWARESKYSIIGAFRGVAQVISYEVSIIFVLLSILLVHRGASLAYCKEYLPIFMFPGSALLWLFTILAETNRSPFDLAEGERELVSGFNTEYASWGFTFLFIGEYTTILAISTFSAIILAPKIVFIGSISFIILFILARATYPRMKVNNLILLSWRHILPLRIVFFGVSTVVLSY